MLISIFPVLIFITDALSSTYTKSYQSTMFCQQQSQLPPTHHVSLREYVYVNAVIVCICIHAHIEAWGQPLVSLPGLKHTD